jgi:hypothetical protein
MNDFAEIESELKKLRPIERSAELFARVRSELSADVAEGKVVRPDRFRMTWLSLGAGLAAAAVLLLFSYLQPNRFSRRQLPIAAASPTPQHARSTSAQQSEFANSLAAAPEFIPARATEVVYRTQDDGLLFPSGSDQPVRRVRARMRETLQWQNPQTGASLRVSYPAEEVTLLPVYGH